MALAEPSGKGQPATAFMVLDHLAAAADLGDCRILAGFRPWTARAPGCHLADLYGDVRIAFTPRLGHMVVLDCLAGDAVPAPADKDNAKEYAMDATPLPAAGRRPTPPGQVLKQHFLKPEGRTVTACAQAVGVSRKHLSRVINGHHRLEPALAAKLARLLGTSTRFWLNLQAAIDAYEADRTLGDWRAGA